MPVTYIRVDHINGAGQVPADARQLEVAPSVPHVERNTKTKRHLVPDVVSDQVLIKLNTNDSARDAAVLMDGHQVRSVLVVDAKGRSRGIFTVRDVARRLVGGHLDPDKTRLSQVMTKQPKCVAATASPQFALRLMQDARYRAEADIHKTL